MPHYEERLKEEFEDHLEDETELEHIPGAKRTDDSTLEQALHMSALEREQIKKKERIGWSILILGVIFHVINSILEETIPFFATDRYLLISGFIEIIVIGIVALYLFPSFKSKLFRD